MPKTKLKSAALSLVLGGTLIVLSGCQVTSVGVSYGYGTPYYDSMLWNDYYHRSNVDVDVDVDINRPQRPDRPARPPNRPKPPIAKPKPPRPPIHRPAGGRPRLR